ncbi:hypothetical protein T4D_3000 [Trichinella pseudospiralis]|uniref:Uncharacterized protein n=1 Tax=Trichinella pseudospiralis TaxID=6337 RepID=A0A0V1G0A2_TRIPS|nr:hypothetical protein T4D_3000 [Trichinella pseudospiralis]
MCFAENQFNLILETYASEGNLQLLNKLLTECGKWKMKMLMMMILIGRQLLGRSSSKVDKYQARISVAVSHLDAALISLQTSLDSTLH